MILKHIQSRLISIGINNSTTTEDTIRVKMVNRLTLFLFVCVLIYIIGNWIAGVHNPMRDQWKPSDFLDIGLLLMFIPVLLINKLGYFKLAAYGLILTLLVVYFANAYHQKIPYRGEMYFFVVAALSVAIIDNKKILLLLYLIYPIAYFYVAWEVYSSLGIEFSDVSLAFRVGFTFSGLFLVVYYIKMEVNFFKQELEIKNSQLQLEKEEIEKINFSKDKIFAIISHDLRSPFNSMRGLLTMVNEGMLNPDEFQQTTKVLEKQVITLSKTLDELLTWSKSQLQGVNPLPANLNLRTAVAQVVDLLKLTARSKKIIVTTHLASDLSVYCDSNMLQSIFTNIISNAIKFTPMGGAVSVTAFQDTDEVVIKIEDTGLGISKENIEKMLNPLVIFTTPGTGNEKGTGLGVAMSLEFITKNKGTLEVTSEDKKGSVFTVRLPAGTKNKSTEKNQTT